MELFDIDPAILSGFIEESLDGLNSLDSLFIELEKSPDDIDCINTIFRPVHSIKGSAAFFNLMNIKELAHKMEDLLDKMRQNQIRATDKTIAVLLKGTDLLREMFNNISQGDDEVKDNDFFSIVLQAIVTEYEQSDEKPSFDMSEYVVSLSDGIDALKQYIPEELSELFNGIKDTVLSIKKYFQSDLLETEVLKEPSDTLDSVLKMLDQPIELISTKEKTGVIRDRLASVLAEVELPETKSKLENSINDFDKCVNNIGFNEILQSELTEILEQIKKQGAFEKKTPQPAEKQKSESDRKEGSDRRATSIAEKTMRISEKKIDSFLAYVSEFVVVEEMFNYLQKKMLSSMNDTTTGEFKRVLETFGSLSANLRKSILDIRMVPAKSFLQKAPRIIHDISADSGKKTEVSIHGDDISIDKSYVEMLDAPFTHIVRNAVDHGIESPDERIAIGKSEAGVISITLKKTEKFIELEICDDGKGLDYEAITRKAKEIGLITDNQKLNNDAIVDLLFMSGVSTAEEVSDISGRGVGMDVVKTNVEAAGGSIRISSEQGKGSTFSITLPTSVSTQIMDGFLVKSGGETYVMPVEVIGESFEMRNEDISTVEGKGELIMRRNELLSMVRLNRDLRCNDSEIKQNVNSSRDMFTENIAISINYADKKYALCVDEIVGVHKVVVRDIVGLKVDKIKFDGAAVLGDGSVAMIIGSDGLESLRL
ncbi:MAG: chemotaxis protein CheA [Desulfobacterales bacterium]|nr:chemotaxis protein CheA [Desulfobacterales bacterium]